MITLNANSRAKGFTLIELMIALVLSLFLLGAILLIFFSAQNSANRAEQLSRVQENIRFASDLIVRDVRNAGFRDDPSASIAFGVEINQEYLHISENGDELTIRYAGRGSCAEPFDTVRLVTNRYFVDPQGQLACQGNLAGGFAPSGDPVPLVGGLSAISFSMLCPDGGDDCECRYNSLTLSGVDGACIGVEMALTFEVLDGEQRTLTLRAALRNVILDRLLAGS